MKTDKFLAISSALLFFSQGLSAQLRVADDGNVYIQDEYEDGHTLLGVGNSPYPYAVAGDYSWTRMGVHAEKYNTNSNASCIGVFGMARQSSTANNGFAVGVWGCGTGAASGMNFGVIGGLSSNLYGAGVYGTIESYPLQAVSGKYAGYFYGPTYVDGTLTASSVYNLSDMRLKENVISLREKSSTERSALDNILTLDVIEYNLRKPEKETIRAGFDKLDSKNMIVLSTMIGNITEFQHKSYRNCFQTWSWKVRMGISQ